MLILLSTEIGSEKYTRNLRGNKMKQRHNDLEYTWSGFFTFVGLISFVLSMAYVYYYAILALLD